VTTRPRPQTAIISKAAKSVSDKRERESADEKARTAALNRWAPRAAVAHAEARIVEYVPEFYEVKK
jgi:hypothetical protein